MRLVTLYAELIHSKLACASSSVPTSSILPYHSFYNPILSSNSINPTQTSLSQSPPSSHSSFTQYSVKHVSPSLVSYTSDEESTTPNTQPATPSHPTQSETSSPNTQSEGSSHNTQTDALSHSISSPVHESNFSLQHTSNSATADVTHSASTNSVSPSLSSLNSAPAPKLHPSNTHRMLTRAKDGIVQPRFQPTLLLTHVEPTSYKQALDISDWFIAMQA